MLLGSLLSYGFSAFLVLSPLTSYLDTILSIHRNKSSSGFSIDVCGIMLVASFLRINFWIGDRFASTLLVQSLVMVVTQFFLLYECLEHRQLNLKNRSISRRPWALWQWNDKRAYWRFLAHFAITLGVLQFVFGTHPVYVSILGTVALGIEATLPIPQFLNNKKIRSVDGVRISMLASWVFGDACKLIWLFLGNEAVSLQFKLCAIVQTFFDAGIAVQWYLWHEGPLSAEIPSTSILKDIPSLPM